MNKDFPKFHSSEHLKHIKELEKSWHALHGLQKLAQKYGISDIFQDNGGKIYQQLIYLNMLPLAGREGNDAVSRSGREWEMKSINLETTASGFSTNHHTNQEIINKYRKVPWTFAIYRGIALEEIWVLTPTQMEPLYRHWEEKLESANHLNNPKISVSFVRQNGVRVYPYPTNPIDPDTLV